MVATANSSFMKGSELSEVNGRNAFFWTMIALAVVDILLLFWLLNPVSKSAYEVQKAMHTASASKRSPLGEMATRVSSKLTRTQGNFKDVSYNAR